MSLVLSPFASEFDTGEKAIDCDHWFRAQIQASLDDGRPCVAHDEVMEEMEGIIAEAEQSQRKFSGLCLRCNI